MANKRISNTGNAEHRLSVRLPPELEESLNDALETSGFTRAEAGRIGVQLFVEAVYKEVARQTSKKKGKVHPPSCKEASAA